MEECFSVQITWKTLLKIIKKPGKLKLTNLPHGILFCQERPGILEGAHKSNLFTQSDLWMLFLTPHPPIQSVLPAKSILKKKPNEL